MVMDERAGGEVFWAVAGSAAKSKACLAKPGRWNSFVSKLAAVLEHRSNGTERYRGWL